MLRMNFNRIFIYLTRARKVLLLNLSGLAAQRLSNMVPPSSYQDRLPNACPMKLSF